MANEFTRKESVTDYQNYAGRAGSQIDYSAEAAKIATGVNLIASEREGKKAKIQGETDNVVAQLEKADSYQNQTLGQTVLLAASALKDNVLMQSQLMKKGKIKPAEYMAFLQTAKDDITNWGIAAKDWDKSYIEADARQKLGANGKKIASATETYIKENILAFQNLNNKVPWVSGTGNVYLVDMVEDEQGNKVMPDWDTQKEKFQNMGSMNNRLHYQDDGIKYDIGGLVKSHTALIGEFITSNITDYSVSAGGGIVIEEKGARQIEKALSGKSGQADFDTLIEDITNSVVNDTTAVANILKQSIGLGYIIAETEQQFVNKGGTDLSKWLKIDMSTVPPSYPDVDDVQKNAAKALVEREILTQLGQTKKHTKGQAGQQDSATAAGTATKDIDDAGYISELNDAFTNPNTGKSKAIIKRLVDSRNSEAKNPEDRIRSINIEDGRIVVKRAGGQDDLIIDRISDSGIIDDPKTLDIDESITNISTEDDIMSLIDILTPGKGISRGRVRDLVKTQNITLGEKRAGSLNTSVARPPLKLITNTTKLASGESMLKSFEDAFSGSTAGDFDSTVISAIDEAVVNAMSNTLKTDISNYGLGDAETVKVKVGGVDYLRVSIAGVTKDIKLESGYSKQNIAKDLVGVINEATKIVNKKREEGRSGKAAGTSYKDWKTANPGKSYSDYLAQR